MNQQLNFTVGFELEFGLHDRAALRLISDRMHESGVSNDLYGRWRHSPVSTEHWDLKTDSSCGVRRGDTGYEAVSPVISTYDELLRHAEAARIIARSGGVVNRRCGLHVHTGVLGNRMCDAQALVRLIKFLSRYEAAFGLLVPPSRRQNQYCKPISAEQFTELRASSTVDIGRSWRDKNTWVNFATLPRIGTVEFRLFQGTLDPVEIVGAVMFLEQVLDCVICHGKNVQAGKASAKDDRMLFYTMLQQAGFYDKRFDPERLCLARKWASGRFRANGGVENPPQEEAQEPQAQEFQDHTPDAQTLQIIRARARAAARVTREAAAGTSASAATAAEYRHEGSATGQSDAPQDQDVVRMDHTISISADALQHAQAPYTVSTDALDQTWTDGTTPVVEFNFP